MSDQVALGRVLAQTSRRIRAQRSLHVGATGLVVSLTATGSAHAAGLRLGLELGPALLVGAAAAITAAFALAAYGWPLQTERAARRLDDSRNQGHDLLRTALEYRSVGTSQRTPFMEAHLRLAERTAAQLSARQAVPFTVPSALRWALLPVLAWAFAGMVVPKQRAAAPVALPVPRATLLDADDLSAFRQDLGQLSREPLAPQARADVQTYNELLERLAKGELSQSAALHTLLTLERKLLSQEGAPTQEELTQLDELAEDLAKANQVIARALRARELDAAIQGLSEAAKELPKQSKAERAQLAEALERARERDKARRAEADKDGEHSLLRRREAETKEPGERSLFHRRQRELDRLQRNSAEPPKRNRELERLSRDLADSADALDRHDDSAAQRGLEQAARDLERFAEQQRGGAQQRELAKQVSQLRELLQRNGGGRKQPQAGAGDGSQRQQQEQRFLLRAQGKQGPNGEPEPGSQQGQGQPGQRQPNGAGNQAGQELQVLAPGDPNARAELLIEQRRLVQSSREGAGQEHDTRTLDKPTDLAAQHRDSQLRGTPGQGLTRSQIILDAADRGFATASYHKVYSDYRSHAEDMIERDEVPAGYRFYVRRYFQLIRPRDE